MKIVVVLFLIELACCQIEVKRRSEQRLGRADSSGKFSMDNEQDFQYYAWIEIGTPGQNCSIVFDTGSNEMWVSTIWGNYKKDASSTYNRTDKRGDIQVDQFFCDYQYQYGIGYVSGHYGTEIVSVPQVQVSKIKQPMLFVTRAEQMGNDTDGLLGLTNDADSPNWLDYAAKAGQLNDAKFAFDLRNQDATTYFYAGSSSFPKETLTWVSVDQTYYWSIPVTTTTINGKTIQQEEGSTDAVVDTGTSLLIMGSNGYKMLMQDPTVSNCQYDQQSEIYICSCTAPYPTITFTAPTMKYLVVPSDYMIALQGSYCALGVMANDLSIPFMLFGDSMMRNYFVAYDKTTGKVGFSEPESQKNDGIVKKLLQK